MSTALAIAATTRVLGSLIDQNIQKANVANVLGGLPPYVTTQAPDQLEAPADEAAKLSLFLYHVTYNQGWREVGLPSRNSGGIAVDRPPLALDLHYLLVAYGQADYVEPRRPGYEDRQFGQPSRVDQSGTRAAEH
ncbi:Pvc16 family protein [Mycolicibacterium sp. CBMA 361]|uniref:Pvc16 family protein n=1 Tax=Mycolicibacterium sp. CBMA 361 TaxID=2606610 RepID=UPI0012DEF2F7|nr:Pvc16 family protein [Mycolicibacterium sp. CBMA 361]MUM35980.1 DUF4255 domain-containing protein [Mycolicibacterium sp. CBMA 361]